MVSQSATENSCQQKSDLMLMAHPVAPWVNFVDILLQFCFISPPSIHKKSTGNSNFNSCESKSKLQRVQMAREIPERSPEEGRVSVREII